MRPGNDQVHEKMLQTNASITLQTGEKRWKTNEEIRKIMNVSNLQSELHYRRLSWLREMLMRPAENVQLRAALVGTLDIDQEDQQDRNPWVQQFIDALKQLLTHMSRPDTLEEDLQAQGDQLLFDRTYMDWLIGAPISSVRSYLDPVPPETEAAENPALRLICNVILEDGSMCPYAGTAAQMNMHRTVTHEKLR